MKTLQEGIDWQLSVTFLYGLATAFILSLVLGLTHTPFWLESVMVASYLAGTYAMVRSHNVLCERVEACDGLVHMDDDMDCGSDGRLRTGEGE